MRDVSYEDMAANVDNLTFGDDRLGVLFYTRTVEDPIRTASEGRKCFTDMEYVKIMVPGDHHNVLDRPVQRTGIVPSDDILRFPQQYARFKQREKQKEHDGTPLALWPQMPGPLAKELEYFNIFTVEQLAEVADTHLGNFFMGTQWKQKAQAFCLALKDQEQVNKLNSALEQRDNEIEALKEAVSEQAAQIKELMKRHG